MKKETKKAPTIRFQGFTDDWEQRKFSELFKRRMERNNGQFDKTKWISVANMYYQDPDKVTSNNIDTRTYVLRLGDISFEGHSNKEFKIGRFVENDIGDGVISELFPIYRHITSYDLNFWKHYINIENIMFPKLQRCIEVSYTSSNKLSEKFFLKESILVPAILEQKKIGTYLKKIDNLITLHQRKLDQLKTLKKYFLQNLFPAKGEKVPRIRFKGFTGDWEQRKLSNCVGFRRGSFPQPYGNKEWYNGEGAMPFVQVADVTDDMKLVDDTKQKISKVAQPMSVFADKGSVLVTLQGSIGRVAIMQYGAFVDRTVLIFNKYNQDIDKIFWAYIIKEKFINEARKAPGGTIKTITKKALSNFDLVLPSYEEQRKLGAFLVSIDSLITLHQRKLNQLQTMKKFMLQNLFI